MFNRPPPDVIKAKLWEIKRRYDRKALVGKRSRGMAAIRISELMRLLNDRIGQGRKLELEPCQQSENIIRIFAHHFMALPAGARRLSTWYDHYCPWLTPRDREYLISEATHCPLRWSADKLAWKLRLTDAKRTELKIKTIGAIDCNREQRRARRKAKRRERDAKRYQTKRRSPNISL